MRIYKFNKKNRLGVTVSLLITVMIPMACLGVAGTCIAAQDDCQKLLSKKTFKTLAKDKIKQIQVSLVATGYDPKEIDGIIGPHSKASLTSFCVDFAKAFSKDSVDDFIATLLRYAALAEKEPQWKKIVLNENFESWINQKPAAKRAEFQKTMSSGTPEDIVSLYERYNADRKRPMPKLEPKLEFDRTGDYIASFSLTEQNFKQLEAKDNIIGELEKLKNKSYDNKDEFAKTVQQAVDPTSDQFKRYQDLIEKAAQLQATYTLTEKSIQTLKKDNIPDSVIAGLQNLQNIEYPDQNEFLKAVQPVIDAVDDQFSQYLPAITKFAQVAGTDQVSQEFLKQLEKKGIPAGLIEKIAALPDKLFADKNEFKKAVRSIIEDVTIEYNFPDDVLAVLTELKKEGLESQRADAQKIINQVIERYYKYQVIILQEIEALPAYLLTAQSYAKLKEGGVPDYIDSTIRELENKGYSDKNLFENALKDKFAGLTGQYRALALKSAEALATYKLSGLSLKKIQDELKAKKNPTGFINNAWHELQGVDYPTQNLFKRAWVSKVNGLYLPLAAKAEFTDGEEDIVKIAKEKHRFNKSKINPQSVAWKGEPCGCVLDELAGKEVYGFYPFWLAGDGAGEQKRDKTDGQNTAQHLDFSVLSRIGYYALPIDEKGDLKLTDDWKIKPNTKFIAEAHRYRTKVDLVVYNLDWKKWCESADIDKITTTIANLLKPKKVRAIDRVQYVLTTLPWNWFTDYDRIGVVADGITIDFDGYPADTAAVKIFLQLIRELRKKLQKSWRDHYLNILLPASAIGRGIYDYENMLEIVKYEAKNETGKLFFLVFLDEPTTDTKKSLRRLIEENYQGEGRKQVLQKIVPIITYAGHDKDLPDYAATYQQLEDDILYGKENFAGIGFWPLPLVQDSEKNDVNKAVKEVFVGKNEQKGMFRKTITDVCVGICPNRWIFRISLDLLIVMLGVFGALCLFNCKVRRFYNNDRKYFWILMGVVVLLILIGFALLYCDPYYQNLRQGNLPLFLVIILFIAITIARYYAKVRKTRNP